MRVRPRPEGFDPVPNLAPLADVILVILIFLMLGSGLMAWDDERATLRADLGADRDVAPTRFAPPVRIELRPAGAPRPDECEIVVMGRSPRESTYAGLEQLMREARAAGADPDAGVVIESAPSLAYRHIIGAMDACVRAGFGRVRIACAARAMTEGE